MSQQTVQIPDAYLAKMKDFEERISLIESYLNKPLKNAKMISLSDSSDEDYEDLDCWDDIY